MLHRLTTYFKDLLASIKTVNENLDFYTESIDAQNTKIDGLLLAINENLTGQRELNSMIVNLLIDEKKVGIEKQKFILAQEEANTETSHDRAF